jgi:hypothetical protein
MERVPNREVYLGAAVLRAAMRRPDLRALALTSSVFAEARGRAQVSRAAARLITEALDVGCAIRWLTPGSRVAVAHPSRAERLWLSALAREETSGIAGVFDKKVRQTGKPAVLSVVWSELLRLWASPAYWPYLESHEVSGLIVLPLCARRRIVGVMTAWRERPRTALVDEDVRFLEEVTRRLALC